MYQRSAVKLSMVAFVFLSGGAVAFVLGDGVLQDGERSVKESEVPARALDTLKKLAPNAKFTEFAEEVEHGRKFYEGSWKATDGQVDALVTEAGDVVELEEGIPMSKVPAAVQAAATKAAGDDARISFERKTMYLYEIHYKKDGKSREMIFTPDARPFEEGNATAGKGDEQNEDEEK